MHGPGRADGTVVFISIRDSFSEELSFVPGKEGSEHLESSSYVICDNPGTARERSAQPGPVVMDTPAKVKNAICQLKSDRGMLGHARRSTCTCRFGLLDERPNSHGNPPGRGKRITSQREMNSFFDTTFAVVSHSVLHHHGERAVASNGPHVDVVCCCSRILSMNWVEVRLAGSFRVQCCTRVLYENLVSRNQVRWFGPLLS